MRFWRIKDLIDLTRTGRDRKRSGGGKVPPLSARHLQALKVLREHRGEPVPVVALAKQLGVCRSEACRVVAGLVAAGFAGTKKGPGGGAYALGGWK